MSTARIRVREYLDRLDNELSPGDGITLAGSVGAHIRSNTRTVEGWHNSVRELHPWGDLLDRVFQPAHAAYTRACRESGINPDPEIEREGNHLRFSSSEKSDALVKLVERMEQHCGEEVL